MASDPVVPAQPTLGGGKNIYVSASGSDSNDGLTTGTPKLTFPAAIALITDGAGEHVLLNKGDTFKWGATDTTNVEFPNVSGLSAADPIVISSYGTGDDPIINGSILYFNFARAPHDYITFYGLDFTAMCRFNLLGWGTGLRFINCHHYDSTYEGNTVVVQQFGNDNDTQTWKNFYWGYNRSERIPWGQGLFLKGGEDVVIEYSLFNEASWDGGTGKGSVGNANIFKHAMYTIDPRGSEIIRHNIFARAGSQGHKMSATKTLEASSSRTCTGNLFVENGMGISVSHPGSGAPAYAHRNINISGNVFQYMYRPTISTSGIRVDNVDGLTIENNAFIHRNDNGNGCIVDAVDSTDRRNVTIQDNARWDWTSTAHGFTNYTDDATQNITVQNNRTSTTAGDFVDTTRSVETFDSGEGGPGTVDSFLSNASSRTTQYNAPCAVEWLLAGFASSTANPPPANISSDRPMALAFAGRGVGIAAPIVSGT